MSGVGRLWSDLAARVNLEWRLRVSGGGLEQRMNRWAFSWSVRAALYRHLAVQVSNDISQIRALETFQLRLERQKRKSCLVVVRDIVRRMQDGASLSAALREWVPIDEALTISGAESAGRVGRAFELLVDSKARIARVRRTMAGAFATPAVYLFAIYGMLWAIGTFFLPSIEKAVPERDIHGAGALLFTLGHFATSWWMLLPVALAIGCIAWTYWALPNWVGRQRVWAERWFPFNLYRDINGYVWLMTFAAMLQAGMSDTRILEDQSRTAGPWLRQRVSAVRRRMLNGEGLAPALLATKLDFPNPELVDDIGSMAGFADFPGRIMRRAEQWADELEWTTQARVRALGFAFDVAMYALMLLVLVGINSLSVQVGNVPGLS